MARLNMKVDTSLRLDGDQYRPRRHKKSLIVLHHTAGGTARSTWKWWNTGDKRAIGTAYIIARDGKVYEVFDPRGWAWHLGVKDQGIEQRSIGIELANAGWLKPIVSENGDVKTVVSWWGRRYPTTGPGIVKLTEWRGKEWFETYPSAQIDATIELVVALCERFGIPKSLPTEARRGKPSLNKWFDFEGVITHAMVRRDKWDLTPQFDYRRLGVALTDQRW